ncbi:MAG TPA: hypothetical protein ENI75_01210 [Mizugakiibacter sp.]|nr:hypothetical protein [Mizugakiibacter sp.]
MLSPSAILWSSIYGSIGIGYFIYGKRQGDFPALFAGIGLLAVSFVISNGYLLALVSIALMAFPWLWRRWY